MTKPNTQSLTRREREIMDILYQKQRATALEVLENMESPPSYSAVRALLRLLEERGHAHHEQDGPRYVYMPAVARTDASRSALAHVVTTFFEGSVADAMATLVESSRDQLSADELGRIAKMIKQAQKEGR